MRRPRAADPLASTVGCGRVSIDPRVARVLAGATVDALTHRNALEVGRLLARTRTVDVIDASVALGAVARDQAVVTSDPDDFERIASAAGLDLRVLPV